MYEELRKRCEEKVIRMFEKLFKEKFVELGITIPEKEVNDLANRTMKGVIELVLFGEVTIKTTVEEVGGNA